MHVGLIAIAEATTYIDSVDFDRFVILTDSKSALLHLAHSASPGRGIPIVYRILESDFRLQSQHKKVILSWIPSHIHIKAKDKLANQAADDGILTNVVPLFSDQLRVVKDICIKNWQDFDEHSRQRGIWYRIIQPQILVLTWLDNITSNRNNLKTVLRLRWEHIPTKKNCILDENISVTSLLGMRCDRRCHTHFKGMCPERTIESTVF